MRFALVAVAFSAVLSSVGAMHLVGRQSFPTCANNCVLDPANLFGCGSSDNVCLCNSQQYVAETTLCIEAACDASDTATAEAYSRELCEQVGVTLTATPTAIPSGTSSSSTPAASNSSSSSGNSGSSSSSPSGTSSTTSPAASNTAPGVDSGNNGSSSSSAPAATNTNAAVSNSAGTFVGVVALAIAALNF